MRKFLLALVAFLLTCVAYAGPVPAPEFTLNDAEGTPISLSKFKGKIVVLEWTNADCPFVKRHYEIGTMKQLAAEYKSKGVEWISINSSKFWSQEKAKRWTADQKLAYPILDDSDGNVGKSYGAKTTPHMFVIAKDGSIAYQGAIDDDADGESDTPKNYVKAALDELLAGKPVSTSETKSYGCSVKYR